MDIKPIMRRVELFRGLTDEQLQQLIDITEVEQFHKGAAIVTQGSIGAKMYIVGDGQVEVQVRDSDGTTYAAIYLGEGQVFGEMALVDQGKRSATVLAVDNNTVIYAMPSDKFNALCQRDTQIGFLMMRNIARDLSFKLRHRDFDPSGS